MLLIDNGQKNQRRLIPIYLATEVLAKPNRTKQKERLRFTVGVSTSLSRSVKKKLQDFCRGKFLSETLYFICLYFRFISFNLFSC